MDDESGPRSARAAGLGAALAATAALLVALAAVPALAGFGDFGSDDPPDPSESPRVDTPDDPEFDHCEADDETTPGRRECTSYFDEQYGAFGFSPDSADEPGGGRTRYDDCSQLDDRGRAANVAAGTRPAHSSRACVRTRGGSTGPATRKR